MSRLSVWLAKRRAEAGWRRGSDHRPAYRRLLDRLRGEAGRIHVFGDSHTMIYQGLPNATVHYIVGVTMHRAGRDDAFFLRGARYRFGRDAVLALVFGEIDTRVHIGAVAERTGVPVSAVVEDLAQRFLDAVDRNRAGRRVVVAAVVPPAETGHRGGDPRYADWGSAEDRVAIGSILNDVLRRGCASRGFGFADSRAAYADERGMLRDELSDGDVHIGHHAAGPALQALEDAIAALPRGATKGRR